MQRIDLYRPIHKAIRSCMLTTVTRVGSMDPLDDADVRAAAEAVRMLLGMLAAHMVNEDVVHRALEARRPGASAGLAHDHEQHANELRALDEALRRLEATAPAAREPLAHALYLQLARFAAENFAHMDVEETTINPLLWSIFSEAELQEIYFRILAGEPPEQVARSLPWLIPALSHGERVGVIQGARAGIPEAMFGALLELTRGLLPARDFARLSAALDAAEAA